MYKQLGSTMTVWRTGKQQRRKSQSSLRGRGEGDKAVSQEDPRESFGAAVQRGGLGFIQGKRMPWLLCVLCVLHLTVSTRYHRTSCKPLPLRTLYEHWWGSEYFCRPGKETSQIAVGFSA